MNRDLFFSSVNQQYETPQWLFDKLNSVFFFKRDLAADSSNAKCKRYFSIHEGTDSLITSWDFIGWQWLNPPYGRELYEWVEKCANEAKEGNNICLLIPARTDTKYQHELIFKHARLVCFVRGRLKFGNSKNSAPFPSQIVLFTNGEIMLNQIDVLNSVGECVTVIR